MRRVLRITSGHWKKSLHYWKKRLDFVFYHLIGCRYFCGMQQGYSPFRIAAFFIQRASEAGVLLTPMKLIKLVYIAHAWSLAILNRALISETVQAWKYGPVIESLYHGFKHFGNSTIPSKEIESLPSGDIDGQTRALLEKVWEKYGMLGATHLSSLTHLPGTPWAMIWEGGAKHARYTPIPDQVIAHYYKQKLETPSGSGH